MKKRILSVLLILTLVFSLTPAAVFAETPTSGKCGENVTWSFDPATGTLHLAGSGPMDDLANGEPWEEYKPDITSAVIDDGITYISYDTFYNCTALTSVTIPESVTSIGGYAFSQCKSLTDVTLPAGLTELPHYLFKDCRKLEDVVIPAGVTAIGTGAFDGCCGLKSIAVPEGVTVIEIYTFYNCSQLTDISLPSGLGKVIGSSFSGCTSLESVYYAGTEEMWNDIIIEEYNEPLTNAARTYGNQIPENAKPTSGKCGKDITWTLDTETGVLHLSGSGSMYNFDKGNAPWDLQRYKITSVVIDDGISSIGSYAFYECRALTDITVPDSVTSIGQYAFYDCYSLSDITLPAGLTDLYSYSFSYTGLEEITIPDGVTIIRGSVFYYCPSLKNVTVPNSVHKIRNNAFESCTSLESVYYAGTEEMWNDILIEYNNDPLINATRTYGNQESGFTLPTSGKCGENISWTFDKETGVLHLAGSGEMDSYDNDYAPWDLQRNHITSVVIDDGITNIGTYAFDSCSALTGITIPESVTSIGDSAFTDCSSLTDITLPAGLTEITLHLFDDCASLEELAIPAGVTTIGACAFWGCERLTSITIPDGVTFIDFCTFFDCNSMKNIVIPSSVEKISSDAFLGCTGIETVSYTGTEEMWNDIKIGDYNSNIKRATHIYNFRPFEKINSYSADRFADVAEGSWYETDVKRAYELGLMIGNSGTTFNPDGEITIAEAVTLASRIHKKYNTGADDFVQGDLWYQVYADYATENGIIAEGEFPDLTAKATREQFAYILSKALPAEQLPELKTVEDGEIPDVEDSAYKDVIYMLYRAGILNGTDDIGSFAPKANIGRSAVAAIVTRMVDPALR